MVFSKWHFRFERIEEAPREHEEMFIKLLQYSEENACANEQGLMKE